jgi:hypothetical protein
MAGYEEGSHPRDDHGKFTAGGGSGPRRAARKASSAAKEKSQGAETQGEHAEARGAHERAAGKQRAAAQSHKEAAAKAHDPQERAGHLAQANHHEARAQQHDAKAKGHEEEGKTAPKEGGVGAWAAKKLEGLTEHLNEAREKVAEGGERAQEREKEALHGDAIEQVVGAAAKVGGHLVSFKMMPTIKGGLVATNLLGGSKKREGKEPEEKEE